MENCKGIVGVWLLVVGFLEAALFANSIVFNNQHVGRTNITEYVENNPDDPIAFQKNVTCAKISYPSLSIFYSRLDEDFAIGAKVNNGEHLYYTFVPHVTVNHHGNPSHLAISGPLNGFSFMQGFGDSYMYACVHKEPYETPPEGSFEPPVTVDWLVYYNKVSTTADTIYLRWITVLHTSVYCPTLLHLGSSTSPESAKTILLNVEPMDASLFPGESASWINAYSVDTAPATPLHIITPCTHVSNTELMIDFVGIFVTIIYNDASIHTGVPPAGTYLTENGNMKLEVAEDSTTDWKLLCTDYAFVEDYTSTPHVFITVSFRDKTSVEPEPEITGWLEFVNEVGFRACVGRTRFAAEVTDGASIPYLEYLVISQDGIYDEETQQIFEKKFFIVLELLLTSDVNAFLIAFDEDVQAFDAIVSAIAPELKIDQIWNYGYMARPDESEAVLIFVSYDIDTMNDTTYLEEKLLEAFVNNRFPYLTGLPANAQNLMNALYPTEPQSDSEKIIVTFWTDWGCPVGPFDSGTCSLDKCNGCRGTKTISRIQLFERRSPHCPALSVEVDCNLPPCSIEPSVFFTEPNPYEVPEDMDCSAGSDLTWLWAIIGVVCGLAVVGGVGVLVLKYRRKY